MENILQRIPRSAEAAELRAALNARRTRGLAAWVHVHGAPGTGKRDLVDALQAAPGHAPLVRATLQPTDGLLIETLIMRDVIAPIAAANVARPVESGWRRGFEGTEAGRQIASAMLAAAGAAGCLIVIERVDAMFDDPNVTIGFVQMFERAGPLPFDLVTTSDFPLALLAGDPVDVPEIALKGFTIPLDPAEMLAEAAEAEATPRERLDAWMETAARKNRGVLRHWSHGTTTERNPNSVAKLRDLCVHRAGGHPLLTIDLLSDLYQSVQIPADIGKVLAARLAAWENNEDLRDRLVPVLSGERTLGSGLTQRACGAIGNWLNGGAEAEDPSLRAFQTSLGLPPRIQSSVPLSRIVSDSWTRESLKTLEARRRHAAKNERSQLADDPHFQDVEEAVRTFFCDPPEMKQINSTLLDEYSRLITGSSDVRQYRFRLSQQRARVEATSGRDKGSSHARRRDKSVTTYTIHVFSGLEEASKHLWLAQVGALRRIAGLRLPALRPIYRAGTIQLPGAEDTKRQWIGFVITEDPDVSLASQPAVIESLRQPFRYVGLERLGPPPLAAQITGLADALDLLHDQGILHQQINLANIGLAGTAEDRQLVLDGFQQATLLRAAAGGLGRRGDASPPRPSERYFLPPEVLAYDPGPSAPTDLQRWMQSDVYAMAVLIIVLLTGEPDDGRLRDLDTGLRQPNPELRRAAAEAFAHALLGDGERWRGQSDSSKAWIDYLGEVRDILRPCLAADYLQRSSATVLHRKLAAAESALKSRLQFGEEEFYLLFDSKNMGVKLKANFLFEGETETPIGQANVRDRLADWLDEAQEIIYAPGGFELAREARREDAERATFLIVGPNIAFYAAYHHNNDGTENRKLLRLSFTVRTRQIQIRPMTERLKVPFPRRVRVFGTAELATLRETQAFEGAPIWTRVLERVMEQKEMLAGESRLATATWRLHALMEEARHRLRRFPVFALPDGDNVSITLDTRRFGDILGSDPALRHVYHSGDPIAYFADTLSAWQEEWRAGSGKIQFVPGREIGGARFDLSVESVVSNGLIVRSQGRDFPKTGTLHFTDGIGAAVARRRQDNAIGRFVDNEILFSHLVEPRQSAPVMLPCDPARKDKVSMEILANVKSSWPLAALQGPPGTGKTTVLAHLVDELLTDDPSARILLTAQSHAAVDTALERVDRHVNDAARETNNSADEAVLLRMFSAFSADRVSQRVRAEHDLAAWVKKVRARMQSADPIRDELRDAGDDVELLKKARDKLRSAAKGSSNEIARRLERSAPLVGCTTAVATTAKSLLRGRIERYDVVIVDEGAKAWGIDMVQPLSIAEKAVLVGDHRQLPPFDAESVRESFRNLSDSVGTGERREISEDMQLVGDPKDIDKALLWLEPFRRLFEKRRTGQSEEDIPVTQTLRTQYRSLQPIGDLVARTFYPGENLSTAQHLHVIPERPVLELGAKRHDPVLCWIDTSAAAGTDTREARFRDTSLHNKGEAELVLRLLTQITRTWQPGTDASKMLRVLSPYKAQTDRIRRELRGRPEARLGQDDDAEFDRVVQTIDSAQGAEADLVIVSLVRSGRIEMPEPDARVAQWEKAINRYFGFLQSPERMNVMFSRARLQMIIVGDLSHFRKLSQLADGLARAQAKAPGTGRKDPKRIYFWRRLLEAFDDTLEGPWGRRVVSVAEIFGGDR
jgi:hypothetical protein